MLRSLRRLARHDVVRHGAMVLGASVVLNVCNYLFHVLNSRRLGVDGYGELASLVALFMILSFPAAALTLAVTKVAAECHAVGDRPGVRKIVDVVLFWGALAGMLLVGLAFVTLPWSERFLRIYQPAAILLTAAASALTLIVPLLRGVLQGVDDFPRFATSTVVEGAAKVTLGVGAVWCGFGVVGALCGFVAASLLALLYMSFALRRHVAAHEARLVIDLRRLSETVGGSALTSLAFSVLGVADVLAVKHFFDPHTAGLYGALSLVGKIFLFAVGFLPQVVLAKVARLNVHGADSRHYLRYSVAVVVGVGVLGIGICAVAPSLIVRLVAGSAFGNIGPLLVPYAFAMTCLAVGMTASSYRIGVHQFGFAPPLLVITLGELVAFAVLHASVAQIVRTVVIGHLLAAAVTVYGPSRNLATRGVPARAEAAA